MISESLKGEEWLRVSPSNSVEHLEKEEWPKISIVTPSYNQGQYIEETIQSVIGQNYPNLEYIIIDGGSTDNTVNVIKKYEKHITYWVSELDNGQAHAINKGFAKATGDILAWINSDDYYLPGTLSFIASIISELHNTIVFGNAIHLFEQTGVIKGSNVTKSFCNRDLSVTDIIIQPSSFWHKSLLHKVGALREDMHYAFDWEWYLRARGCPDTILKPIEKYLSVYRMTEIQKTTTGGEIRRKEILKVHKLYSSNSIANGATYIAKELEKIKKFKRLTSRLRPRVLEIILFKLRFFKLYNLKYRDITAILNNM